ncbi:MAG: hypothetical protein K8U03_24105 [Planctomycetia bacterium]|nr:hypothetical protein [Planctomycetia bacterium]
MNTSTPIRLSDFQQIMLYWNDVWPFQVVDVVEVRAVVDPVALRSAAGAELERMGAVGPILSARREDYTFRGGAANVEVRSIANHPEKSSDVQLQEEVVAELSRRFTANEDELIRLWIIPTPSGTIVGMTWQHWFADGLTAADLLRRILRRLLDPAGDDGPSLTDLSSPVESPFERCGAALYLKATVDVLRVMTTSPTVACDEPIFNGTLSAVPALVAQPQDCLAKLSQLSKAWRVTVNDLVVAVLMKAFQETSDVALGDRSLRTRIGNIVDLRRFGDESLACKAGQFLALMLLDAPHSAGMSWRERVTKINRRSTYLKESHLFTSTLGAFRFGRRILAVMPRRFLPDAIAMSMRMSAVITNLRLPDAWSAAKWTELTHGYRRFLPPNLCSSIVLGLTTKGKELTMTFTIRDGVGCERTLQPAFERELNSLLKEVPT